jgi:hypothetical protein
MNCRCLVAAAVAMPLSEIGRQPRRLHSQATVS